MFLSGLDFLILANSNSSKISSWCESNLLSTCQFIRCTTHTDSPTSNWCCSNSENRWIFLWLTDQCLMKAALLHALSCNIIRHGILCTSFQGSWIEKHSRDWDGHSSDKWLSSPKFRRSYGHITRCRWMKQEMRKCFCGSSDKHQTPAAEEGVSFLSIFDTEVKVDGSLHVACQLHTHADCRAHSHLCIGFSSVSLVNIPFPLNNTLLSRSR